MKLLSALTIGLALLLAAPAYAHQEIDANGLDAEVGWRTEPAIVGVPNAVVFITDAQSASRVRLSVELGFGDRVDVKRPLEPTEEPEVLAADVIPTRAGTYSFHLTGTVNGRAFDRTLTSGERTFDDVVAPGDLQFPEKDPTTGDLGTRAARADDRITLASRIGADADGKADKAVLLGLSGTFIGLVALVDGLRRRRRKAA